MFYVGVRQLSQHQNHRHCNDPHKDTPMNADPGTAVSDHTRLRATYGVLCTIVEILAAACFIAGSILSLNEDTTHTGTLLFLFGSISFGLRPTIRLAREFHLWRLGRLEELAKDGKP